MGAGPCQLCERAAELFTDDRICETCQQSFGKLCTVCAAAPCPKCGSTLSKAEDVFPHSLFQAIRGGSVADVERILHGRSVDLDHLYDRTKHHPLARAARLDHRDHAFAMCQLLLRKGATPRAKTQEVGRTALILMVRYRVFHKAVARMLCASVNDTDDEGRTALTYAVQGQGLFGQRPGNLGIAKCLVSMGADASIQNRRGQTAMDYAVKANDTNRNNAMIAYLRSIRD